MKPGILNLSKWSAKTAEAVRRICDKEQKPCVAFTLVLIDTDGYSTSFKYVIEMAYDPHNPPSEDERKQLSESLTYISEGIKKIMGGDIAEVTRGIEEKRDLH